MKRPGWGLLLSLYFWQRLKQFLLFAILTAIMGVVIWLHRLDPGAVWYGALLCSCFGLVVLVLDFVAFARKTWGLRAALTQVGNGSIHLPPPRGPIEAAYAALVQHQQAFLNHRLEEAARAQRELHAYYTLWAHQVKTPIAAMRLLLQADQANAGQDLQLELMKIEQYVEMALSYLHLDGEGHDFVIRRQPLEPIVRQAVRKLSKLFIRKKIKLALSPLDTMVLTDDKWLAFVVEQVLTNALKYTNRGTIAIYLDPEQEKALTIEDTGIGIAPTDLPRVFEQGFTGFNGRRDKRATGIGLYLCRRILTQLGHGIAITSEPDKGTKVTIDLATMDIRQD